MEYHELFSYCQLTGNLRWKERTGTPKKVGKFNKTCAGNIAGAKAYATKDASKPRGMVVRVRGHEKPDQYVHRVVWEMTNGPIPDGMVIDHINGNPFDNRLSNLRLATPSQNIHNRRVRHDCTSGVKGVRYDKARGLWSADIIANGVRHRLGRFETKGLAAVARAKAALRLHGKFARYA